MIDVLNRKTFRAHVHTSGRSHVRLTDYIVASWPAENFRAFTMFAFKEEARVSVPSPDASFKLFSRYYKALFFTKKTAGNRAQRKHLE